MAVSNPARLSSVISEFGGGSPTNLRSYLRGGTYVYNLPTTYPDVASSGPLRLAGFAGLIQVPASLPLSIVSSKTRVGTGITMTAYINVNNDGSYAYMTQAGIVSGTWKLAAGNASDYEIMYYSTSGDTPNGDVVGYWLNLGTSRAWSLSQSTVGLKSYGPTSLQIREALSPYRSITTSTASLYVEIESSQCQTCCFTPETLIMMANYSTKPIVDIRVGDRILTRCGSKEVTEIITREFRVMYQIHFADGRILNASEDHPLYVEGKGYAAINPVGKYKDLGMVEELAIGDFVLDVNGKRNEIVSIADLDYPHTVYTFAESEFYANGMLVY